MFRKQSTTPYATVLFLLAYCLAATTAVLAIRWIEARFDVVTTGLADFLVVIAAALMLWFALRYRQHAQLQQTVDEKQEAAVLSEQTLGSLGIGFWHYQPETDHVQMSASYAALLKEHPDRLLNARPLDYVHPDDRELVQQRISNALGGQETSFCSIHRLINSQGDVIPVVAQGLIRRDESETVVDMFGLDIDRSIQQTSEHNLSRLASDLDIGLWENDFLLPSNHFFSDQMFRMLGRPPVRPEQAMEFFLNLIHPDDIDAFRVIADEILAPNGKEHYRSVFRLQHADGRWIWILSTGRCVERDDKGYCRRVVGSHIDVSDISTLHSSQSATRETMRQKA